MQRTWLSVLLGQTYDSTLSSKQMLECKKARKESPIHTVRVDPLKYNTKEFGSNAMPARQSMRIPKKPSLGDK